MGPNLEGYFDNLEAAAKVQMEASAAQLAEVEAEASAAAQAKDT